MELDDEGRGEILHEFGTGEVVAHLHQVDGEHLHHIDALRAKHLIEISK